MALILNIETSTAVCSAALTEGDEVLFEQHSFEGPSHASLLGVYVEKALQWAKAQGRTLDAVAVSCGPGSYTGLRIGVSVAKGLCFGADIPLISVPTLTLLADTAIRRMEQPADSRYCAMIDARRMEVYAAVYDRSLREVRETGADVVTADTYKEFLDRGPVYFFGNGAAKCMEVINHPNAHLIEGIEPEARWMFPLAERRIMQEQFEDVAYFVPHYLKDFVSKKPKSLL